MLMRHHDPAAAAGDLEDCADDMIFERTARWLETDPNAKFHLVVDELMNYILNVMLYANSCVNPILYAFMSG